MAAHMNMFRHIIDFMLAAVGLENQLPDQLFHQPTPGRTTGPAAAEENTPHTLPRKMPELGEVPCHLQRPHRNSKRRALVGESSDRLGVPLTEKGHHRALGGLYLGLLAPFK